MARIDPLGGTNATVLAQNSLKSPFGTFAGVSTSALPLNNLKSNSLILTIYARSCIASSENHADAGTMGVLRPV